MKMQAIKGWINPWLMILGCCWMGHVWAIGETCSDIWTQALRPNSPVPAWGYCFGNNPACYNVTGASTINSLPASLTAGDYFLTGAIPNNTNFAAAAATVRIYVNGSLSIGNDVRLNQSGPAQNLLIVVSGSVTIGNNARINGFILAGGGLTINNSAGTIINGGITANGAVSSGSNSSITFNSTALSLLQAGVVCSLGLNCFNDTFQTSSLSDSWVVTRSSGSFTPSIVNGRMRITQNVGDQATAATFQRLFPGVANLVVVEFDQFAYGSTSGEGADGMAMVLSNASITPQPGAFGGPLGYGVKPGIPGFAGGWLGVGIDEYGNYSAEGGPASPGRRRQAVALRGSGSGSNGYRYLAGTCNNGTTNINSNCLSPTVDNNSASGHRYKVTVDSRVSGQAMVKVERNTGSGYQTLINNFNALSASGQAAVPTNFVLSLTGSTGGANNIHELDNLQICALKSEPIGEQIDHFEFSYSGQALTCKPETFTIKACKNPSCSELVTGSVSATLSPSTGWISGTGLTGGHVLNFTGGTATATLSQTTPATINVGVSASLPAAKPLSTTLCQIGGSLSAANCNVLFSETGLEFSVPDKLAAQPASGIVVRAVKSDGNQACVPSFSNVNRIISFWSDYVTPMTPSAVPAARVTVTHGANTSTIGTSSGTATPMNLSFNTIGEATIAVNYADAGLLNLNARYTGSTANNDAGLTLNGADEFVSAPQGLCITAEQVCPTPNATCPVYKKAGQAFTTVISARAWQSNSDSNYCDNATTPSFSRGSVPLSHSLVQPVGGVSGTLTPVSYNHAAQASAQTSVSMSLSEVGIFNLQAGGNLTYLGMPITLGSSMINPLGRIVPDRFELVTGSSITSTCSGFHYLSQPANLSMMVRALNSAGAITSNYRSTFAKATSSLVAENSNNGTSLTSRIQQFTGGMSWNNGVSTLSAAPFSLLRASTVDGPFESVLFGLTLQDNDGNVSVLSGLDQRVDSTGNCVAAANCLSKTLDQARPWRYGRMQVVNALGSEQSNLPVQLKAEYWSGQQFVLHAADNCSPVAPSRLVLTAGSQPVLTVSGSNKTLNNGSTTAFDLLLSAPGVQSRYPLTYQLNDYPWLQFDWDPNNAQLLENPQGEVVFGGFRGNNRQIFWREN
jgi:hypothetical protein